MLDKRVAIRVEEAQKRLLENAVMLGAEQIQTADANGRILAEEVTATMAMPYFRRSGYDGFAIRAEDDSNYPRTFQVVADVPCGAAYNHDLQENETVRIMTGAKVPENAGKIIMLEQSRETGDSATITLINTHKNTNITERGEEFESGAPLLQAHHHLNPGSISLLAAFGIPTVTVFRRPRVAILSTGSELVQPGSPLPDGKIFNSNHLMLAALAADAGAEVIAVEQIEDDLALTKNRLTDLAKQADLILTTGGVSVGDFDFMAIIAKEDAELLYNKIQMRPGSVTTAMRYENTLVAALSGNPGACFTAFHLLIAPVLAKMSGDIETQFTFQTAKMGADYSKNNAYDRFLRGQLLYEAGELTAVPVGSDMSSALGNLHLTECLIKIPSGKTGKNKGEEIEIWRLSSK
ncbi:molybdopterin biosynthesis protein MoeA [Listeria weihenstephanensis FSL R9-0317]|uniref:Molybdopterin molybdenumtransferase n=1 Tax=Listeria weihenstephanensis TaxID=1006155 RepID=A0A1S7FW52_9LIST|nr:gephyrin-like molybdotransferase Glp [Listeria weihenstephanensis]AQY51674.1 molybdopterin biosynthesis protein MoeA [Listeria weihenstephanensis]EUJ41315.1 molybdopterin biosynthesis protein MoeA [Listeria weihenstephanensis FSL R9-0317]